MRYFNKLRAESFELRDKKATSFTRHAARLKNDANYKSQSARETTSCKLNDVAYGVWPEACSVFRVSQLIAHSLP